MKIYFFGSDSCDKCKKVLSSIKTAGLKDDSFQYIDALADDTQDFCDKHGVDDLPHVKVFDDNDNLVFNRVGEFDVNSLKNIKTNKTILDISKE